MAFLKLVDARDQNQVRKLTQFFKNAPSEAHIVTVSCSYTDDVLEKALGEYKPVAQTSYSELKPGSDRILQTMGEILRTNDNAAHLVVVVEPAVHQLLSQTNLKKLQVEKPVKREIERHGSTNSLFESEKTSGVGSYHHR
jgi:hypothetical protein